MPIQEAEDVLKLEPFETAEYADSSLVVLTAYSTYWLARWGLSTTLENIGVVNYRLFPAKFSVVGWPQFPDLLRTNRSLMQMRPKHRNMATSVTTEGVFLNGRGRAEAEALLAKLGPPNSASGSKDRSAARPHVRAERGRGRPRTVHPEEIVARAKASDLFKLYVSGDWAEARTIQLIEMLSVYDHTPGEEKKRRLGQIGNAAKALADPELADFVSVVRKKFGEYLAREKAGRSSRR